MACFITFEGIDGTGKTTQANMLVQSLTQRGWPVVHTREPGGTQLGQTLRQLLLEQSTMHIAPMSEMLLMAADRAQHVIEVIQPALKAGQIVVSERYVHSSIAYQSAAGIEKSVIRQVNEVATSGLKPDVTILFDAAPTEAFITEDKDRIEGRSLAYHEVVREAYVSLQRADSERIVLVSVAGKTPEAIHAEVIRIVDDTLRKVVGTCEYEQYRNENGQ